MSTKSGKILLIAVLVLYFLFIVIANIPARLLASAIHKQVPVVWLNSVEGSIWKGSAGAAQVDVQPFALPLGRLTWELNPWSLLALNPCVKFQTTQKGQNISGELCHSLGGTSSVHNVSMDSSMALVNGLVGTDLKGRASLEVQKAEFSQQRVKALQASLTWHNARVLIMEQWVNLGSLAAKFKAGESGGVEADIFDMQAPFKVDMKAYWSAQAGWTVSGLVTPTEITPAEYVEGLKFLGEETEGSYKLSFP